MSGPNIRARPRPTPQPASAFAVDTSDHEGMPFGLDEPSEGFGAPCDLPPEALDVDEAPPAVPQATYEIGYGKPPVATRFGGPRGNRSGRKKGSRSHGTIIDEELNAKVAVPGAGKLSKMQVAVRQLVNQAAKGEIKAVLAVLKLAADRERVKEARQRELDREAPPPTLDQADRAVMDIMIEMVTEAASLLSSPNTSSLNSVSGDC